MFDIGNQVIVKSTGDTGYIYSIVDKDLYCVYVIVDNKLCQIKMLSDTDIRLKPCQHSDTGLCNYCTTGSRGMFACMYCELERE